MVLTRFSGRTDSESLTDGHTRTHRMSPAPFFNADGGKKNIRAFVVPVAAASTRLIDFID